MSKAGKLVKDLVKTKKESVMGKLGDSPYEDPMEPWSSKYNSPVKNEEVGADDESKRKAASDDMKSVKKKFNYTHHVDAPGKKFLKAVHAVVKKHGNYGKYQVWNHFGGADGELPNWYKEEVEQIVEMDKSQPSSSRGAEGLPTGTKADPAKTKDVKKYALAVLNKKYKKIPAKSVKEEIEELSEDTWLFAYIRSLGYNPKVMNFAQRSKYARSNAFKHWKQSHMERRPGETATMEENEHLEEAPMYDSGWRKIKPHKDAHGNPIKNVSKHLAKMGMKMAAKKKAVKEENEQLDEAGTGLLMTFIKAKGLNPLTMDGNQKHAYARSSEFKIFKQKHQTEEVELQETSGMGERGEDWNEEMGCYTPMKKKKLKKAYKKLKESLDKADTVTMDIPLLIRVLEYAREDAKTDMDLHKVVENLIKMRDQGALSMDQYDAIVKITEDIQKIQELKKIPDNMDADDHITREEKKMKGPDPCWKGYQMVGTKKKAGRTVPNCVPEQVQEGIGGVEDSPLSATNSVKAMESAHRQKQMKSARMIKALYKNKIKETTYDWEKDDKPNAKIVMKGGTTMTGQPRDTIEIEPVLKTRPNSAKPSN